ncbi:MAG: hypothetical protein JNL50_04580 [Phycisphaerae bacterium]|nr:hypothetical protein [Phycisphaerae bacterium]
MNKFLAVACLAVAFASGCAKPWHGGMGPAPLGAPWSAVLHAAAPAGDIYPLVRRVYSGVNGATHVQAMIVPDPDNSAMLSLEETTYNAAPAAAVNLKRGFAYLIGRWPIIIVKGGSGGGDGTKIAAHIVPSTTNPNHTRFFLINPTPAQKLVVLVHKGPGIPPDRYELTQEGCIEISDEDGDGIGKYESTTNRRNADGSLAWAEPIEQEYQTLAQNAADARLDF